MAIVDLVYVGAKSLVFINATTAASEELQLGVC